MKLGAQDFRSNVGKCLHFLRDKFEEEIRSLWSGSWTTARGLVGFGLCSAMSCKWDEVQLLSQVITNTKSHNSLRIYANVDVTLKGRTHIQSLRTKK